MSWRKGGWGKYSLRGRRLNCTGGEGGEAHRRKREREWDEKGWEEWVMEGEQLNDAAIGGNGGENGGENVDVKSDGANGGEIEGNKRDVGDGEGREMDGGGCGGRVEEGALTEGGSRSRRKPLRGGRRGTKNKKMSEGEKERLALYMAKWLGKGST